jgi:hypothetical protein
MPFINTRENQEVDQVSKIIEEAVSGHRSKIVLRALDKVKTDVMDKAVFKRDKDV